MKVVPWIGAPAWSWILKAKPGGNPARYDSTIDELAAVRHQIDAVAGRPRVVLGTQAGALSQPTGVFPQPGGDLAIVDAAENAGLC
jgi:hypothetical protein